MRILYCILFLFLLACNNKKKDQKDTSNYFPVKSFMQSQIKELDTSMYRFIRVDNRNGQADTSDISREDAVKLASEFSDIPNLRDADEGQDYAAMTTYDSLTNRVIMSYTAFESEDAEVIKQDVTIMPLFGAGEDEVKTIYIEKISEDDGTITEKKLLWETRKFFQIRTITRKPDATEKIEDVKIIWNASQWDQ